MNYDLVNPAQMERARQAIHKRGVAEYGWKTESMSYDFEQLYDYVIGLYLDRVIHMDTALGILHEVRVAENRYLEALERTRVGVNILRGENARLHAEMDDYRTESWERSEHN